MVGMTANGLGLGEEADLIALKYQICTTLNEKHNCSEYHHSPLFCQTRVI